MALPKYTGMNFQRPTQLTNLQKSGLRALGNRTADAARADAKSAKLNAAFSKNWAYSMKTHQLPGNIKVPRTKLKSQLRKGLQTKGLQRNYSK